IPSDNPFVGRTSGALRASVALGLRNPFALTAHPTLGTRHVHDAVGATKSTIHPLVPGANYGHQGNPGIGVPTSAWVTVGDAGGALVTGGAWMPAGGPFPPEWHGSLFTTLWGKNGSQGGPPGDLNVVASATDPTVVPFLPSVGTVDAAGTTLKPIQPRVGPDGDLYFVLTSYTTDGGEVRRVRYTGEAHAETPVLSPPGGTFAAPPTVTLSTGTPGATVRYTLDGTAPTEGSTPYAGPFAVPFTATVRARSFAPPLLPSGIAEAHFEVEDGENVPPIASAGPDQTVAAGSEAKLIGAASTDPDGDDLLLTDAWQQVSGPPVALGNADETVAFFTPRLVGRYGFRYTVDDGEDESQDETVVHVVPCVHDVLDGLAVRWRFDAGAGPTALDAAGGTANGAIDGATWTTDQPDPSKAGGHALDFDGVDDVVTVDGLDVGGEGVSFSAWIRADDFGQMDGRILSKATGVQDDEHHWMLSTIAAGGGYRLRWRLKAGGSTSTLIASAGDLVPGVWTHVAAVYDGQTMTLYRDAVPVGVLPKQGALATDPTVGVAIGNQPPGAGARPFDGRIDELRIYSRALSPEEVLVLFANLPDRPCPEPTAGKSGTKPP
ncbi:MAG: LamG-like jellyroll fold domain-containing protein, partial [Planctomycetota bacterium JB042]